MKTLLVILALSITSAQAAKWEKIPQKHSVFSSLLKGLKLHKVVYELLDKSNSEQIENSLKQLTYFHRAKEWGEYSVPEFVTIGKSSVEEFGEIFLIDNTQTEPYSMTESTLSRVKSFVQNNNELELFDGNDGNNLGDCSNVYIYHKAQKQVAILSLCYAE